MQKIWYLVFQSPFDNFRDILNLHRILFVQPLNTIIEHGNTEGAGGGHDLSSGIKGFFHAGLVDTFADFLLHPGESATATAAKALTTMTLHFGDTAAVEDVEHTSGLLVNAVVASDITGIVIGQFTGVETFLQVQFFVC